MKLQIKENLQTYIDDIMACKMMKGRGREGEGSGGERVYADIVRDTLANNSRALDDRFCCIVSYFVARLSTASSSLSDFPSARRVRFWIFYRTYLHRGTAFREEYNSRFDARLDESGDQIRKRIVKFATYESIRRCKDSELRARRSRSAPTRNVCFRSTSLLIRKTLPKEN